MNLIRVDEPCQRREEFQRICDDLLSGFDGKKVIRLKDDNFFSIHDTKRNVKPIDPNHAKMQELMGRFLAPNISFLAEVDRQLQIILCLRCTPQVFNALDASLQAITKRNPFFSKNRAVLNRQKIELQSDCDALNQETKKIQRDIQEQNLVLKTNDWKLAKKRAAEDGREPIGDLEKIFLV